MTKLIKTTLILAAVLAVNYAKAESYLVCSAQALSSCKEVTKKEALISLAKSDKAIVYRVNQQILSDKATLKNAPKK